MVAFILVGPAAGAVPAHDPAPAGTAMDGPPDVDTGEGLMGLSQPVLQNAMVAARRATSLWAEATNAASALATTMRATVLLPSRAICRGVACPRLRAMSSADV